MNDGARTRDISDHNRVLYQLSYAHHVLCRVLTLPAYLFRGRIVSRAYEERCAVIRQFSDGILNISERAVIAGLGRGCEVGLWLPASGKFFNR